MSAITLLTGGPGSGKSTIARLVAKRFPRCFVINVDELREMMVSGRSPPERGWSDEALQEFRRARAAAINMARLYASQGIEVIIDDVCVPAEFVDHYAPLFADPGARRILLHPSAATMIQRMERRRNPWDELLITKVPDLQEQLARMPKEGWAVIDPSDWTIEQTVAAVLQIMGRNSSGAGGLGVS
jgi:predicted kinase